MSKLAHDFKQKSRTGDVIISENVDFSGLLLSEHVLRGLKNCGFHKPSPIQLKAIPLGRCGLDLIVQAKSGTGKTCVFSVVALESIQTESLSTQVLILAPTREIAVQIWEVLSSIGSAVVGLKCHMFIGGLPLHEDRVKLRKCHIAVGSPGRIKQLIQCEALRTESIRLFVLDEADKLLEESFQEQINWIYSALPDNKQMLALSATYPEYLADHLTAYMRNPTFLRLNIEDPALLGIRQYCCTVPSHPMSHVVFEEKTKVLTTILSSVSFQQCLIFSNLQTRAQNLADNLSNQGWPTACIAGCLDQKDRNAAMAKLKSYKCRILISTDLTSRGIDADKVSMVVNMDVPKDHETYLHRIGRAGRFGSFGVAVTLVSEGQEKINLNSVEKKCNTCIHDLPDPIPSDLARPDSPVFLNDVVSSEVINTENKKATPHYRTGHGAALPETEQSVKPRQLTLDKESLKLDKKVLETDKKLAADQIVKTSALQTAAGYAATEMAAGYAATEIEDTETNKATSVSIPTSHNHVNGGLDKTTTVPIQRQLLERSEERCGNNDTLHQSVIDNSKTAESPAEKGVFSSPRKQTVDVGTAPNGTVVEQVPPVNSAGETVVNGRHPAHAGDPVLGGAPPVNSAGDIVVNGNHTVHAGDQVVDGVHRVEFAGGGKETRKKGVAAIPKKSKSVQYRVPVKQHVKQTEVPEYTTPRCDYQDIPKLSLKELFGCRKVRTPHTYSSAQASMEKYVKSRGLRESEGDTAACDRPFISLERPASSNREKLLAAVSCLQGVFVENQLPNTYLRLEETVFVPSDVGVEQNQKVKQRNSSQKGKNKGKDVNTQHMDSATKLQAETRKEKVFDKLKSHKAVESVASKSASPQPVHFDSSKQRSSLSKDPVQRSDKKNNIKDLSVKQTGTNTTATSVKQERRPRSRKAFSLGYMMESGELFDQTPEPSSSAIVDDLVSETSSLTLENARVTLDSNTDQNLAKESNLSECQGKETGEDEVTGTRRRKSSSNDSKAEIEVSFRKDSGTSVDPKSEESDSEVVSCNEISSDEALEEKAGQKLVNFRRPKRVQFGSDIQDKASSSSQVKGGLTFRQNKLRGHQPSIQSESTYRKQAENSQHGVSTAEFDWSHPNYYQNTTPPASYTNQEYYYPYWYPSNSSAWYPSDGYLDYLGYSGCSVYPSNPYYPSGYGATSPLMDADTMQRMYHMQRDYISSMISHQ